MQVRCLREGSVWRLGLAPAGPAGPSATLIDEAGLAALTALLAEARADASCRALVLEGGEPGPAGRRAEGASFCEGLDLGEVLRAPRPEQHAPRVQAFARCLEELRRSPRVILAVVDGAAAGGGVGLAAAADLVLASTRASFVLPELSLGLLPAVVLPVLLERLSPQAARALALGGAIGARRAYELGLVDQLAEPEELERLLRSALKQILRLHPEGPRELKQLCARQARLPLAEALALGAEHTAAALADEGRARALRGFLEGEPLPWFERYRPGVTHE